MSKRFVSWQDDPDEEEAQLRQAVSAVLELWFETMESGEDPHTVALPEQLVAQGRSALSVGVSVQHMRRAADKCLEVLHAYALEGIDHVSCSDAARADLRNRTIEMHNVLLERLSAAVLAK
jgi:hypothetical protein